jgi:hypothetical protein
MAEVVKTLPATDVPELWRPPTWRGGAAGELDGMQLCEKPSDLKARRSRDGNAEALS